MENKNPESRVDALTKFQNEWPMFMVLTRGDGGEAYVLQGWKAMEEEVLAAVYGSVEDALSDETSKELLTDLNERDNWSDNGRNEPYIWETSYEDGSVSVIRITNMKEQKDGKQETRQEVREESSQEGSQEVAKEKGGEETETSRR